MENEVRAEKTGWWKSFLSSEFFFHYKHNIPAIIGSILVLIAILTAVVGRFLAPQKMCIRDRGGDGPGGDPAPIHQCLPSHRQSLLFQ